MAQTKQTITGNWLNEILGIMQDNIEILFDKIFLAVQDMLHNGVSYSIVGTIIMLWVLNRLKQGYPTRDEMFEASKWLIMTCFVFAIFSSFSAKS